jgi:hypothetical protein
MFSGFSTAPVIIAPKWASNPSGVLVAILRSIMPRFELA